MGDLSRRRWWPLAEVLTTDRLQHMFDAAVAETDSVRRWPSSWPPPWPTSWSAGWSR